MGQARRHRDRLLQLITENDGLHLYKYLRKDFATALVTRGNMRIGTVNDYQNELKHGTAIGDATENRTLVTEHVRHRESRGSTDLSWVGQGAIGIPAHVSVTVRDSDFTAIVRSPNCFVYSTARALSDRLRVDVENSACVRIKEPDEFFARIFAHLKNHNIVKSYRVRNCRYGEKEVSLSRFDYLPPEELKKLEYNYQVERRGIFYPVAHQIEPLIVDIRDVCELCEIVRQ